MIVFETGTEFCTEFCTALGLQEIEMSLTCYIINANNLLVLTAVSTFNKNEVLILNRPSMFTHSSIVLN